MKPSPRVLLVATSISDCGIRMVPALKTVGFEVAAHCPAFHLFTQVHDLRVLKTSPRFLSAVSALCRSLQRWQPDILLPCDDSAVRLLHDTYSQSRQWAALIERSLGNPRTFSIVRSRTNFLSLMKQAEGVSLPEWTVLEDSDDVRSQLQAKDFPLVLKRGGSSGGAGVRIARNLEAAANAYEELNRRPSLLGKFREILENTAFGVCRKHSLEDRAIAEQRYIPGQRANRIVFCWKGEVLAGISVAVLKALRETAPATVVERIEHPGMNTTAAAAVRLLGISGFCGFDFILEHGNRRAWLLEMNPRVTPTAHLAFGEKQDLAAALYGICSLGPAAVRSALGHRTIALFPKEFPWDPLNAPFQSAYHDVPWDDSNLVAACIRRNAQSDLYGRLRSLFLRARKCVPNFLLKPAYSAPVGNLALCERPRGTADNVIWFGVSRHTLPTKTMAKRSISPNADF